LCHPDNAQKCLRDHQFEPAPSSRIDAGADKALNPGART
jgi:hypothetical protein